MKTIFSSPEPRFGADARGLTVVRSAAARRMKLSVDPRNGVVRLSLPDRAPLRAAYRWVEDQRGWIEGQLARLPEGRPILPGSVLTVDDEALTIDWAAERPRAIRRAPGRLLVGGPVETVNARVLRWLKAEARRVIEQETRALAVIARVSVARVSVGDQRSRWGSCSSAGDIRYSWRLILAPAFVRRSTVAHEVAHRVHMDHSPAFHAVAARLYGSDPAPARAWLRANGAALHWVGPKLREQPSRSPFVPSEVEGRGLRYSVSRRRST